MSYMPDIRLEAMGPARSLPPGGLLGTISIGCVRLEAKKIQKYRVNDGSGSPALVQLKPTANHKILPWRWAAVLL